MISVPQFSGFVVVPLGGGCHFAKGIGSAFLGTLAVRSDQIAPAIPGVVFSITSAIISPPSCCAEVSNSPAAGGLA